MAAGARRSADRLWAGGPGGLGGGECVSRVVRVAGRAPGRAPLAAHAARPYLAQEARSSCIARAGALATVERGVAARGAGARLFARGDSRRPGRGGKSLGQPVAALVTRKRRPQPIRTCRAIAPGSAAPL